MIDKRIFFNFDRPLFFVALLLSCLGIFFVYSASTDNLGTSTDFVIKQIIWLFAGVIIVAVILFIDYKILMDWSYILYGISLILLVFLLLLGKARLGAQRWFEFGGVTIQPSEFTKITFILAVSTYLTKRKYEINLKTILFSFLISSPAMFLILKQPDLGTALLLLPVMFAILFVAGARPKYLLNIILAMGCFAPLAWHFLRDYQKERLSVFLNPNIDPLGAGYTVIQSKIAIGSGRIFGKGWLAGTQSRLNFLPERHTDFIFSVIGEEWGFLGVLLIILLFAFLIRRAIQIAETTEDDFGRFVAGGLCALIAFQSIINIGMTAGFMPVVGLPLPFISYGGSNLLSIFIAIGLLLNIKMRRAIF